jgi:hypothetical protein
MAKGINYRQLTYKAFRQMLAEVLAQVAREGLPGKHHFYITFDTTHPGVDLPVWLRARHPAEMTIVMQEWFEDLAVMKDRFSVTLSFSDTPTPIVVPFEAIKTFADPSVEFGLRFDPWEAGEMPPAEPAEQKEPPAPTPIKPDGSVVSLDKFRKT